MPKLSKQKRHLYSQFQRIGIQKILEKIDNDSLPIVHNTLTNIAIGAPEEGMFQSIPNALKLFTSMRNPKGKHANEIISPYMQKKALDFIMDPPKNQVALKYSIGGQL
ncbi:9094_t:CDS:2 [Racocetra fulgida]|uniref:9094_t:CDS:1 n=1 Tax=Racocetra fulgida TaxID=60492 RepID=A0A9N8WIZ3_9GLOM|nr:9094_t:CDS:2 [Racocetra fulgida]